MELGDALQKMDLCHKDTQLPEKITGQLLTVWFSTNNLSLE
jgi:hypothetical protein